LRVCREKDQGAVINVAGDERVSRYELGEILCEIIDADKDLLIPNTMDENGVPYKVADVSMNNDKMKSFGIYPNRFAK
jgi:dTDP-4-dehydrorhamnose reductase